MLYKWLSNGSISLMRSQSTYTIDDRERVSLTTPVMHSGTGDRFTMTNGQKKDVETSSRWTKYKPALKTLLPYRFPTSPPSVIPSSNSGLFSYVTITWLTSLMWKALRSGLTREDLWELHENDKVERNARRLNRLWEEEKLNRGTEASFFRCVWRFGKTRFCVCIFLMIFTVIVQFLVPAWILNWILNYIEGTQPVQIGIGLALLILITQSIRNLTFCGLWMIGIHTGIRVEGAMQYMTYEKLLRLRNGGDNILSKAVTFCTNDQERIFECVAGGVLVMASPVMFTMSLIYTTIIIGPWALLGNAIIFIFYPIMGGVAAGVASIRRRTVKQTNARVGLMTEILNAIRLIKMYGWEDSFADKIARYRETEEKELRKAAFLQSLTVTMTPMINIIASIVTFLGFTLSGNDLTASMAWSIFSVFAAMQFTVGTLPFAVRSIAETSVCFRNFQKYLDLPEYENITSDNVPCDHDSVIVMKSADFAWELVTSDEAPVQVQKKGKEKKSRRLKSDRNRVSGSKPENDALAEIKEVEEPPQCLADINIEIKRGHLIGISGSTGSGKSSLLSAILGEVMKTKGDVLIRGSLAIVSQQAWIYSDTFQDNILFGSPMIKEKYEKVLEVCCLKEDLALLPEGDKTIIGDRGVNLSGGQKQRLNLARSVYSDRSIYLLDDPLSAVDAVIGKTIFQKCVKEYLKDKTVLLVTHGIEYLEQCDEVIFMKDGRVAERGTHKELLSQQQEYYNLLQYAHVRDETSRRDSLTPVKEQQKVENGPVTVKTDNNLDYLKNEEEEFKDSGYRSYVHFMKAGGGFFVVLMVFTLLLLFAVIRIFTTVWLQVWIDEGDGQMEERLNATSYNETISDHTKKGSVTDNPNLAMYQLTIGGSVVLAYFIGALKGLATTRFVLRGASTLHNQMFCRIMKCPLSFFDSSPVGRIVNRFSKDMDELDARMPFFFEFVTQALIYIVAMIIVVCWIFPLLSVAMLIIFGVMIFLGAWLNIGVRQTKKLDNVLKSPVVGHLQSSMGGLTIIRTYNRQAVFQQRFSEHLNKHLAAEAVFRIANRWFTVRMDIIGLAAIFCTVLYGILMRGAISPASVGLAFSSVYTVCTFMPFVMRMLSELNSRFTSVERILDYGMTLEIESEAAAPIDVKKGSWPSKGEIVIDSITMRYRQELPVVLHGVSLHIIGGEKIGLVGRTGAGKSSIMAALLRLCDLESGQILIDGINIAEIQRKSLRQEVAVIPQDPILFQGTVRYNLDPFDDYTDEELWDALEKSNLKIKVSKLKKSLLSNVEAEGENFSVGEKQLICLTRAILRKNKILLLDEATASVDIETDALIQASIRSTFTSCTVLTIAHRLNTITSYDRIAVIDAGKVQEFDTPANLMKSKNSAFYTMMKAAGISSLEQTALPGSAKQEHK